MFNKSTEAVGLSFLNDQVDFRENHLNDLFFIATSINLILEMFPIKSTGSFFSTYNAAYIFLMSGIILSYKKLSQNKNFK